MRKRTIVVAVVVLGGVALSGFALYRHKQNVEYRMERPRSGYRIGDDDPKEKPDPATTKKASGPPTCEDKVAMVLRCVSSRSPGDFVPGSDNDPRGGPLWQDLMATCQARHATNPEEHQELVECQVRGRCGDLSRCQTEYNHAVK